MISRKGATPSTDSHDAQEMLAGDSLAGLFKTTIELSPDIICITDLDGRIRYANAEATRAHGVEDTKELVGVSGLSLVAPDDLERAQENMVRLLEDGHQKNVEYNLLRADGSSYVGELSATRVDDANGQPSFLAVVIRDITERKGTEDALHRSEAKYRSFIASSHEVIYSKDREGRYRILNLHAALGIGGSCIEEVAGKTDYEFLPKEQADLLREADERVRRTETEIEVEEVVRNAKGEDRIYLSKKWPSFDENGKLDLINCFALDITERKAGKWALRESESRFRAVFEAAAVGIAVAGADGRIMHSNQALDAMLGYAAGQLVDRQVLELMHPEQREDFAGTMERLKENQASGIRVERRLLRKDGSALWVQVTVSLLWGEQGQLRQCIALLQDIDERKRTQDKLEDYQDKLRTLASRLTVAEEQERRRIASGLHDSAAQDLVGAAMRLRQLKEDAGDKHPFAQALTDIHALVHKTSRELRTLSLDLSPPLLFKVGLEAAIDAYARRFQAYHAISCSFLDDGAPKPLGNDTRALLYRCTCELLANVAKHSEAETVRVELQRVDKEVVIRVADNGNGFDASRFGTRLDAESGFGLFSVQERLRPLGGHLHVESEKGRGTRATIYFPIDLGKLEEEGHPS